MSLGPISVDDFSHNQVQYIEDPFTFYALMRERSPAHLSETIFGGTWLMFRYEDCSRLMQDERLSNARSAVPLRFLPPDQRDEFADMLDVYSRWLAFHDGKEHTRNRRQANRGYVPFTDEYLEPRIQRIVDGLLDQVDPTGFDLMSELAFPLPAMVIADVLGVPVDAHEDLNRWTDDIAHLFGSTSVSVEHLRRTRESTRQLAEFLASEANARRSRAEGGLLHHLREIEVRGHRFSERDVVAQAALLLFAGVASIRYLIGNSVRALASVPTTERDVLLKSDTVGPAIEELLRMCTPVSFVGRVAGEDFDYTASDGTIVPLRKGQPLLLYIASANRDPDAFDRADELVLDRPLPNRHLTFGVGRHLCFGDPLVRQTTRIALSTLYLRWPELKVPQQEANWNNNLGFHGSTSLRVSGED
ncbi:cytochrome P450 [Streptomyces sp. NBC_00654]|uniref:cytochrome P450 n=1 Tax=Streptomyces sp. NBC_00654 TaxID=2975799 RepID=UPI00225804EA|nr:cytochrome P450 [Streptomyces sp. NBC_00654]MCX4966994.1 cytochrome P450 [Streptomyces sp. NBC_00654]